MPVSFLGLVVTASITVFILLIYRQLDRGSRSLDKVRRYAEMVRGKLTEFIDEKTAEIKDISIELQVNLKTGKEILKKVQSIQAELNEKIASISGAQSQVEEYEASLANLADMARRVDENLARIHEESKFVDGVAQRLRAACGRMDAIEARISGLLDETAGANARRLEESVAAVTAGAAERVARIEETVVRCEGQVRDFSAYIARLESRREQVEKQLERDLRRTADEVIVAARDAHGKLVVDLNAALAALAESGKQKQESLEEKLREALEKAESRAAELEKELEESAARTVGLAEGRVGELDKRLVDAFARFEADFARIETEHKKALEAAAERGRALEDEAFAGLRELIDKHRREAGTLLEGVRREAQERANAAHRHLEELYGRLRSDAKVWEAETQKAIEERGAALAGQIDAVAEAAIQRAGEVDRRLEAMQRVLAEIAGAEAEARERLEDYRARFTERLEAAVTEVQAEVIERAEKRLADLEADVAYRFDRLQQINADVQDLETNLRELMEKASGRVSDDFQAHVELLEQRRQEERQRTEQVISGLRSQMQGIEQALSDLKAKAYQDVSAKLKGFEDEFLADLRRRSQGMEETLATWQQNLEKRMHQISEVHTNERSRIEEEYRDGLAQRIEQIKALNQQRFAQIDEEIENRIGALQLELEREQTRLEEQLAQVRAALVAWQHEIDVASREQKERVRSELSELGARLEELRAALEEKTESALDAARRQGETLENELRIRSQSLRDDIEDQLRLFRNASADIKEKVDATQARLLAKIEEEYASASARLAQIERQQKEFVAQTRLFEQAERFKLDLEKGIDELKRELAALEPARKELAQIEGDFLGTRRLVEEVSGKLSRFLTEKRRIDSLDKDFARLIGISKSIDVKLAAVSATGDTLDEVQVKLRELEGLQREVEARYERLEKRQAILDATTEGVQKNFEALGEIERNLSEVRRELEGLPARVEQIRGMVEALSVDKERADQTVERLARLDEVLRDIEERMEALNKAREWLAKTETRLETIGKQAQEQVKLLRALVKTDGLKREKGAPPLDTRQTVVKLANQGWSAPEIAKVTGISLGEVELILELTPQGK